MSKHKTPKLSYKDAGVDIEAGERLVHKIKHAASRTQRKEVLSGLGGFGALFELPTGYSAPVLVSGTDGVGTKLKLATMLDQHDTIGIDLVAMCVNDLLVTGAEPLFFLDYYATGELNVETAASVVNGIGTGCELAGCALVGGETAEMPGMYSGEDYDLAGFCVGVVEKSKIITGATVSPGDTLIALASSGAHSNGYSLIRKIIEVTQADLQMDLDGSPLGEQLLQPTRIYVKAVLELLRTLPVNTLAHITGGGITENLPRVLPKSTRAVINTRSWTWPSLFDWLQTQGNIETDEMYRTFNCGVGMILAVPPEHAKKAVATLCAQGEKAWVIGHVEHSEQATPDVVFSTGA